MDREVKEGDKNTAYFHVVANHRRSKTLVHALQGPNGSASNSKETLDIVVNFYKGLFSKEEQTSFSLSDDFFASPNKVNSVRMKLFQLPSLKRKSEMPFLVHTLMELLAQMACLGSFFSNLGI